jgi:hypothetical protein
MDEKAKDMIQGAVIALHSIQDLEDKEVDTKLLHQLQAAISEALGEGWAKEYESEAQALGHLKVMTKLEVLSEMLDAPYEHTDEMAYVLSCQLPTPPEPLEPVCEKCGDSGLIKARAFDYLSGEHYLEVPCDCLDK